MVQQKHSTNYKTFFATPKIQQKIKYPKTKKNKKNNNNILTEKDSIRDQMPSFRSIFPVVFSFARTFY